MSNLLSTLGSTVDVWEVAATRSKWKLDGALQHRSGQMLVNTYNQVAADGDQVGADVVREQLAAPNNCGDGTLGADAAAVLQPIRPSAGPRDGIDYVLLSWYS